RPQDSMTWQVYVGTIGANKLAREDQLIFIALQPSKILTIMDNVFDAFTPGEAESGSGVRLAQRAEIQKAVKDMESNKRAVILSAQQLALTHKRVGDRIKVTGINFNGIDLECEIVGGFPPGRYDRF